MIVHGLVAGIFAIPFVVGAAGLVPCGGPSGDTYLDSAGVPRDASHSCGFNDLVVMANTIVHFLLYDIAVPLAALGFMFVGGRLIINQDKEGEWSKAKEAFGDIGKGFLIILGSYVLIKFAIAQFLNTEGGFTLFLLN